VNDTAARSSGETHFFRDIGQFDLLRLRILPELIERHRDSKTLRLWSAGCSSGEEAYSLAMLVDMLLPARDDWDIFILGSDIDKTALEKARRGHYGAWSFRMELSTVQKRYFQRKGNEWALDECVRRMVTFRKDDLIRDTFPGGELRDMDLILCRNVFIYFSADTVFAVANKLAATLSIGGYLMTGHTELIGHRVQHLQSRLFANSVVYQRVSPKPAALPTTAHPASPPHLVQRVPDVPTPVLPAVAARPSSAREFADRGEYARAEQLCRQALAIAPLAVEPHFLLAQIAQLRGDFTLATQLLEKTLYLDPRHVAAYLELAALCERAENLRRAQTLRRAALEIVRALPGDSIIDPYEASAAELAQWLAQ
jgi:chemotaxis protein methyltransferase CheR